MAVKLPDTLVPMADFPSAFAKDVQFTDGENLQDKLDKGKLGSSSGGTGLTEEQANNIEKIPTIEGIVTSNSQAIENKADKDHEHTEYLTEIPDEYVIDTELSTELDKKVNKEVGKGLSTNDLTDELVVKINSSATEAFVTNAIANAQLGDKEVDLSGYATVDALNLKADLTHTHDQYLTEVPDEYITETELTDKNYADKEYVTQAVNNVNVDLTEYAKTSDIPTKVSQLTNDSNFITTIPEEYITDTELSSKGYATETFVTNKIAEASLSGGDVDLSGYATKDDVPTKTSELTNDSGFITSDDLPTTILDDLNIANNTTYSSYRLDTLLKALKDENIEYCNSAISGLNKLSKEIITNKSQITNENTIYLLLTDSVNNVYEQWLLINGTPYMIGTTETKLNSVYTKDEADDRYALLTDFNILTTSFNDLEKSVEKKIDEIDLKANITTTINSTSTDTQVPSAKTIYDKFIVDKMKDYYVNINNSTALSKYGINDITTLTSLLSLTSKLETNARFTMQINDAVKKTLYNCGVIPVNAGGLLVITQQSRGKAVYTTDFCETYVSVTSNAKSTEWGKWEKLRTTIGVADVGVTTIKPVNSAITGTIEYTVKNGICYVSLINVQSETNSNGLSISTKMPKPVVSSRYTIPKLEASGSIGIVYINKNTTQLIANIYTPYVYGSCSFSYPVAES